MPLYDLDETGENQVKMGEARVEMKPFTKLYQLSPEEQETLNDFLTGPQIDYYCELDEGSDYTVPYIGSGGQQLVARVGMVITINGVRWNIVPGKNVIPVPVYEFIMQAKHARDVMYAPRPGVEKNLGLFRAS